jgi:hypothetical protein
MLKFDETNVPEDATLPSENDFRELLNSKPSLGALHLTKGTKAEGAEKGNTQKHPPTGQADW